VIINCFFGREPMPLESLAAFKTTRYILEIMYCFVLMQY